MSGELTALVIAVAGFIVLKILKWIKNTIPKDHYAKGLRSVRQYKREEGWQNQDDGG